MPIIDSSTATVFERRDSASASRAAPGQTPAVGEIVSRTASFAEVAALLNRENSGNTATRTTAMQSPATRSFKFWEKDDLAFGDIVDIVNPLQHIPIVATLYRNWSGDQIGAAPRVIGGALWGRAGGLVTGIFNTVVEWFTGKDVGDHIYAMLFGAPKAAANDAALVQVKGPLSVGANKSAAILTISAPVADESPAELSPAINDRPLVESTLHSADLQTGSANLKITESELVPALDAVPWTAASALHIFLNHDRQVTSKKDSVPPVLRYIA